VQCRRGKKKVMKKQRRNKEKDWQEKRNSCSKIGVWNPMGRQLLCVSAWAKLRGSIMVVDSWSRDRVLLQWANRADSNQRVDRPRQLICPLVDEKCLVVLSSGKTISDITTPPLFCIVQAPFMQLWHDPLLPFII
jgi:hypothetical protein